MSKELSTTTTTTETDPLGAVMRSAGAISSVERIARFRGRPMVMEATPYPHFVPLHRERFNDIAYPLLGGVTRSRMSDVFSYISSTAQDLTSNEHLILFGTGSDHPDYHHAEGQQLVWDMEALEFVDIDPVETVWRSPFGVIERHEAIPFITSLAGNDPEKYDDIMQSLAPLVMAKKPDGVIWWVGDGANGKSTLMDAIYRMFPGQLSSITVKRLMDGRDTPSLNGTLANVVKESSEGRVDDTEIYKAIGTHEDFRVHKFHSQDDILVRGNLHHIFSANNIPVFNDKGYSARRRTFIVPFTERFESDPTFEERTFTPELMGRLIAEMCRYAVKLREQSYKYKFSAVTLEAKMEYDVEANNAEEYGRHLVSEGVVAFDSFGPIKTDYDNWCADMGYIPLGISNLRRAVQASGFDRTTVRDGGRVANRYMLKTVSAGDLQPVGMSRPGMYTVPGFMEAPNFQPPLPVKHEPKEPEDEFEMEERIVSVKPLLQGKW